MFGTSVEFAFPHQPNRLHSRCLGGVQFFLDVGEEEDLFRR